MSKFTPGPWKVGKSYTDEPAIRLAYDDTVCVAVACTLIDGEAKANALLIAAAPEGYELAKRIVADLEAIETVELSQAEIGFLAMAQAIISKVDIDPNP